MFQNSSDVRGLSVEGETKHALTLNFDPGCLKILQQYFSPSVETVEK